MILITSIIFGLIQRLAVGQICFRELRDLLKILIVKLVILLILKEGVINYILVGIFQVFIGIAVVVECCSNKQFVIVIKK